MKNTHAIRDLVYPLVDQALTNTKTHNAYKKYVNDFFSKRDTEVYDALPCSRIACSEDEMDLLFAALNIDKKFVTDAITQTYYGPMTNFNPRAAKHEFTVTQLCVIRWMVLNGDNKERDLSMLLLAFSGKFYPSRHYNQWKVCLPARHVMEYVVNNKLSQKYDLASEGSVMGAVKSVGTTWLNTYKTKFKNFSDEDCVYLIQQLHSRIGSFLKNIADAYYKAYSDKDIYMTYSSDSFEEDNFHMADNDTLKVEKLTESVMASITSNGVDYKICRACSDENITPGEAKAVIESIIMEPENILTIKELISLIISTYFMTTDDKNVTDISFISYTVAPKPNTKQKEILREKEIIENFLCESGTAYLRRRSRVSTRNSYERCVKMYFALVIHNIGRRR